MTYHRRTVEAAKGKWRGILLELGLPALLLTGKHTACPFCASKDNFRWDNKNGSGSFICTCGSGHGMKLAMDFTGQRFEDLAPRIDAMLGNIKVDAPRPAMSDDQRKAYLREVYTASQPIRPGDLAHRYLESRRIAERIYPDALRFAPKLRDGDGGIRPCMVAMIGVHGDLTPSGRQRFESIHRTFLRPDGLAKAEMDSPRKIMPGELADGACVMMSDWPGHGPIGIAEGIETAMSASALFDVPVWAALNTAMLVKWTPPPGADEVIIFGDNDASRAGQKAAWRLLAELKSDARWENLDVKVLIPPREGNDWADEWMAQCQP